MARLLIHVEGPTEEDFVNDILRNHLVNQGYESVGARIVGNNRLRRRRGGIRPWPSVRKDIVKHLRQDPGCIATTMVDFYGLPRQGEGAWPGREGATGPATARKALHVEKALLRNVVETMGQKFNDSSLRECFRPFPNSPVPVHEERVADPRRLSNGAD